MSRVNYRQTAAHSEELPPAYKAVYVEAFDQLTTSMLKNPAPITLAHFAPIVEILREKFNNHDLDRDNVLMPAPMPPPSTPAPTFRK